MEFNRLVDLGLKSDERRQYERKRLIIEISYRGGEATGIAGTRDIGLGGLFLVTKKNFSVGDALTLKMTLGENEPKTIVLKGVVAYLEEGSGIGIRFNELTPETEALLKKELEIN